MHILETESIIMHPLPETPFTIVANDTAFSQNTKSSEPHIVNLTVESFTDDILSHKWSADTLLEGMHT